MTASVLRGPRIVNRTTLRASTSSEDTEAASELRRIDAQASSASSATNPVARQAYIPLCVMTARRRRAAPSRTSRMLSRQHHPPHRRAHRPSATHRPQLRKGMSAMQTRDVFARPNREDKRMSAGKALLERIISDMAARGLEPDTREREVLSVAEGLADQMEALTNDVKAEGYSTRLKSGRSAETL
jgi:hypothetical protein